MTLRGATEDGNGSSGTPAKERRPATSEPGPRIVEAAL
jgi:hypothetical protein